VAVILIQGVNFYGNTDGDRNRCFAVGVRFVPNEHGAGNLFYQRLVFIKKYWRCRKSEIVSYNNL
jgi:hypothetical protein